MRIARLDLARFGKFTDRAVDFPPAERDFHLVVGPNEAGKSTLRNAILDLLFGIETRSRYNFLHPHPEMRLGARLEQGGEALEFVRSKGRNKTLATPAGEVLPDDALAPLLGGVERDFFEQMFGLSHDRLVSGGREILDASNDVGRILFQSAAGVGSLGEIRDALEREADGLWAPRASKQRAYYQALDDMKEAERALREATVRTRDWDAARRDVTEVEARLEVARSDWQALESRRARLDRIRRVAPQLAALRDAEVALAALGAVPSLPPDAGRQLGEARRTMVEGRAALDLALQQAEALDARLAGIRPDAVVLAHADEITALAERRVQLRNHPADIEKRRGEIETRWQTLRQQAAQLGWPDEDEASLAARVPGSLTRAALAGLAKRWPLLEQQRIAARSALDEHEAEVQDTEAGIAAHQAVELPEGLAEALAAAQALGDADGQLEQLRRGEARAERELDAARGLLAPWVLAPDRLRTLVLPSTEEVAGLREHAQELGRRERAAVERLESLDAELAEAVLAERQFARSRQPVTAEELADARTLRDRSWVAIRDGERSPQQGASGFETLIAEADRLADQRYEKAQDVAEMQALVDRRERLEAQRAEAERRAAAARSAVGTFETRWQARMDALGLAGMPLAQLGDWRLARDGVVRGVDVLDEAVAARSSIKARIDAVRGQLAACLGADAGMPVLIRSAARLLEEAAASRENARVLDARLVRARQARETGARKVAEAQAALDAWQDEWAATLVKTNLPSDCAVAVAESALGLCEKIEAGLSAIDELRRSRIETMQRDLSQFAGQAAALAAECGAELAGESAEAIAQALEQRLRAALEAEREQARLRKDRADCGQRIEAHRLTLAGAQASLAPLLRAAGVADEAALDPLIERAERVRQLQTTRDAAIASIGKAGDGLALDQLASECDASDPAVREAELETSRVDAQAAMEEQGRLGGLLADARRKLERISGEADAARAEARRQEALAAMAGAAERYLRVATAARLLRWAIERYREARQGPMLERAGTLFSSLTLGGFGRLVVDYEHNPPSLNGARADNSVVPIEGMSDGTRDQLYLALRLAALELHLDHAPAMPFIADDLVINYDDARSRAALAALGELSRRTQVIFLSHHDHLVDVAREVFGQGLNVVRM
ncbi:YhaN family protein [Cognatazoarcus halotolerans]|uniref:YhaN family protein n=1 Tax=Cognatazoarcus halotolerans TaxID=2686016 RepID=UPI001358AE2C|nr:YhaN family protein [Cognatazoarcus halotolerans]